LGLTASREAGRATGEQQARAGRSATYTPERPAICMQGVEQIITHSCVMSFSGELNSIKCSDRIKVSTEVDGSFLNKPSSHAKLGSFNSSQPLFSHTSILESVWFLNRWSSSLGLRVLYSSEVSPAPLWRHGGTDHW